MSCEGCGTTSNGSSNGCGSGGSCNSGSCGSGKLNVFDWLSNMNLPNGQEAFDCVEIRFKNDRKAFFRNTNKLSLYIGDIVAVEAQNGHDIGVITLTGELVRIQMKKKKVKEDSEEVRKIYRKANEKDIETWHSFRNKEEETRKAARRIATNLGLEMKISDVEYQGDGTKATFYYTAEGRVDFRELIKQYASSFGIRIEMRQIGYRQEAAKVGGIGSCGRELCCSTWLTDFRSVNTTAARYQQLSINPQKLAGQCGKLKCCLNFELDSYLDALEDFPPMESTFETEKGTASCMKIDVFKKEMWFAYNQGGITWHKFTVDQAKEFIAMSKQGVKTASLEDLAKDLEEFKKEMVDVIGENSLERFERKKQNRKRKKKPTKGGEGKPESRNKNQNQSAKQEPRAKKGNPNQQNRNNNRKKGEERKGEEKKVETGQNKPKSRKPRPQNNQKKKPNSPNKKDENK